MAKQLCWSTERRRLGNLVPHKFNPRLATEKFKQTLTRLLKKFGLVEMDRLGDLRLHLFEIGDEVAIGDRMEMTFRRFYTVDGVHNYFWKARPV